MKKFITTRKMTTWALSACLLVSLVSCGSDDDDSDSGSGSGSAEETVEGTFTGTLAPVNPSVSSASGTTNMEIAADDFTAQVRMSSAGVGTHAQAIYSGRCPSASDDANTDGVIDANEALTALGDVVLALDSDLEEEGGNSPSGNSYNYNEDGSVTEILAATGASVLSLDAKTVAVLGISNSAELPDTAQGERANFPISCGTLALEAGGTTGDTGTTTGDTGTTTGDTGTTTGDTGTTTGDTGTTTGDTGTTTGDTGTTTGTTGTTGAPNPTTTTASVF